MQQFGAPPTFAGLDNYARIFADERLLPVVTRSILFCLVNAFLTVAIGLGLALLMKAVHGAVRITMQVVLLLAWATPARGRGDRLPVAVRLPRRRRQLAARADRPRPVRRLRLARAADDVLRRRDPRHRVDVGAVRGDVPVRRPHAGLRGGPRGGPSGRARPSQILRHILLPLVRPVLAIVLLLQIIWDLRVFAQIRLLQDAGGAPISETNLLGNFIYELGIGSQDFSGAAAVSIFVLLLTVLLAAPYVRSLMKEDAA